MFEIQHYLDESGRDFYADWYLSLKDSKTRRVIDRRLNRVALGHFGDCKPVGGGVWELRIDFGAGLRLYYALSGKTVVLLLCGGSKRTQQADIAKAHACWKHYQSIQGHQDENTLAR